MSKIPLEIESTLEFLREDSVVNIQICCEAGKKLNAQTIIDCVSDMLFTYYGTTPEEWAEIDVGKLDS